MSNYTTKQGDMWDQIARKLWGDAGLAGRLMEANPECLGLFFFPAGIVLAVPEIKTESTAASLPPWKR